MKHRLETANAPATSEWLFGGGEMGELVRAMDWSVTPLGSRATWPCCLRNAVNMVFACSFPMAILWGSDLCFVYNDASRIIVGEKHPAAIGRSTREVWPEMWALNQPIFARVMAHGETIHLEDQLFPITRAGAPEEGYFTVSYSPISTEDGQVGGTLVTLLETTPRIMAERQRQQEDITERKRAEEALRESEQEFRTLAEAIPQIVWATRPDGWNIYFNQRWMDYTGLTLEESYGHGWNTPFHPDDKLRAWEAWQRATQYNENYSLKCRLRRADGVYHWWLIRGVPVRGANGEIQKWFGTCTDIEELKQAEEALQRSREMLTEELSVLLEAVPAGVYISHDADCRHMTGNRAADEILRIPHGNELSLTAPEDSKPVHFRTLKDGRELRLDELPAQRSARGEYIRDFEFTLAFDDGILRHVLGYGTPLFDQQGAPRGSVAILVDITARKQAEMVLRVSEERYRNLFSVMPSGVAIYEVINDGIDPDGKDFIFSDMNPAGEMIDHVQRAEIIGKSLYDYFPAVREMGLVDVFRRVWQTGEPEYFPVTLYTDNNISLWVTNYVWRLPSGELVALFDDITEHKRAEQDLRDSERRERERAEELAVLLEAVPIPVIIVHDPDGRHMTGNRRADELLQHPRGAELSLSAPVESKPDHFRALRDGRELQLDELPAQRAARGEEVKDFEFDLVFIDGLVRHLLGYGTPLLDEQGCPRGAVHTLVDITARKQAEMALQASLHEKEVLLKEIHHRVKNNMQVISSLISLQSNTLDDPVMRSLFSDLSHRVRAMALVHEKLYQSESLAAVDFAEYTRSLLASLWRAHGQEAASVRLTQHLEPVSISIEQAVPCGLLLNELVTNALKHAFRDRTDGELTVALHADPQGTVCMTVRDNGLGLPADWRQSPSLGLKLVQMLSRQLDGALDVRTECGTAFSVTFTPPSTSPPGEVRHA